MLTRKGIHVVWTPIRYVILPGGGGEGGTSGNSWWGVCRPVLQILTLFQIKKCHFPHPFSDMEVVTKRNITRLHKTEINVIIAEIKTATKRFLEMHFEFEYYTSFSFIWNWNDAHIDIQPWFLRKPYPIPDQNGQNLYPFSDQNCAKALSSGAAHTYMAYIRDYPPPPPTLPGWLSTLEIGEAQLHSVTTISPKSRFLCVNQSPIR